MNTNNYELAVLINGKSIAKYSHEGKLFVELRENAEYTLKVTNKTYKRVLAIVSVDGVNVIDGSPVSQYGTGYIVNAYSSIDIKGFRESNTHVGTFKVTKKDNAYAGEVAGSTSNCGVVGVMIIDEYPTWTYTTTYGSTVKCGGHAPEWYSSDSITSGPMGTYSCCVTNDSGCKSEPLGRDALRGASMKLGATATASNASNVQSRKAEFDLGSTWGQRVYDKVETVPFERGNLAETIELFYASADSLIAMGVPICKEKAISFPNAFPGQFCKAPSNYKG